MNENPKGFAVATPEPVRWRSISAAIASISVVGIAIGLGMPLLSIIMESRGQSATMIGLNTAVAGLASIAGAPLATPLAIRFGVVWTLVAMIVIGALAFTAFYFATDFWMWFPLRVILHVALTVLFILSEFWTTIFSLSRSSMRPSAAADPIIARMTRTAVSLLIAWGSKPEPAGASDGSTASARGWPDL